MLSPRWQKVGAAIGVAGFPYAGVKWLQMDVETREALAGALQCVPPPQDASAMLDLRTENVAQRLPRQPHVVGRPLAIRFKKDQRKF